MSGRKGRRQPELFVVGSLRDDLLPDDHVLVRVDRVLDLGWLHAEVAELYDAGIGPPSIDPEVALRLMLLGFLLGFVHDRRLMREAQVNLAIRWFCGHGLHEPLPDHSSLTKVASAGAPSASARSSNARFRSDSATPVAGAVLAQVNIRRHREYSAAAVAHYHRRYIGYYVG